jgi:hypothetical protein
MTSCPLLQPLQQVLKREHESQVASILDHGDAPFAADPLTLQYTIPLLAMVDAADVGSMSDVVAALADLRRTYGG